MILVLADAPMRCPGPIGSLIGADGPSTSSTTSLVTPCMVRSPVTCSFPDPVLFTDLDLNVMVGNFCTSKKCGLFKSLSRISKRVSTELASMVASSESLDGSAGSCVTEPVTLENAPRTVETPRCFTENCAAVCLGSICQVPA